MKPILTFAGLLSAMALLAAAQTYSPGRVVIPLRNGGPRTVELSTSMGSITVRTHATGDIIAELEGAAAQSTRTVDGMHRIDISPGNRIVVTEQDNVIHLQAPLPAGLHGMILTVPVETSLNLKTSMGNIQVEGVHGEIDATTANGNITLTNVSGTVVASTVMGSQHISMDRVDASKPLAFSSVNGAIDVTFPPNLKANLSFRTGMGEIWSDFDVMLTGDGSAGGMRSLNGSRHRSTDHTMNGTINGGGVEISFHGVNGRISIHKRK